MYKLNLIKKISLIGFVSLLTLSSSLYETSAWANNSNNTNIGLPGRRVAGGTRGGSVDQACSSYHSPLVALTPENSVSKTISTSSNLFFYVPETNATSEAELILRDAEDNLVYETTVRLNGKAGIISINLPNILKVNQAKQDYHWYFSVICEHDRAQDLVVEGLIRKVELEPELAQQINQASLLEQVELYENAELWHEALNLVATNLNSDHATELELKWVELLTNVGLGYLANQPLVANYTQAQPNHYQSALTSLNH